MYIEFVRCPPFTSEYVQRIKLPKGKKPIQKRLRTGYVYDADGDHQMRWKEWMQEGYSELSELYHNVGDLKKTWEVIHDGSGLYSYHIEQNLKYKKVLATAFVVDDGEGNAEDDDISDDEDEDDEE